MIELFLASCVVLVSMSSCAVSSLTRISTNMDDVQLPTDLETALALIRQQAAAIQELSASHDKLKKQFEELSLAMKHMLSGKRREQFINPGQGLLNFADDPELQEALAQAKVEAGTLVKEHERKKKDKGIKPRRDESFPEHLPRTVVEIPLDDEKQKLVDEGKAKILRHEIRETLMIKQPKLYVIQYRQPVMAYVNEPEKGIFTPVRPMAIGDEGRYGASIGATIVANKFGFHLPYYRLQDIFGSCGWTPARSTIDHITSEVDFVLSPITDLMKKRILKGRVIGLDDTHITLLMPRELPSVEDSDDVRTKRLLEKVAEALKANKPSLDAKMWVYSGQADEPYDVFDFQVTRHREGPAEFLQGYAGYAMADCYSGNLSVILEPGSAMTRMACWAHARRKLYEAKDNDLNKALLPLALIAQLYDIERRMTESSVADRAAVRANESRKILDKLRQWLDGPIASSILPQSSLGKAVSYIKNHWEALCVYTTAGDLPIDNNAIERLMKRVACGRKNWLFVGSVRAGIRNARLMSLVSSAYRHDLDVEAYLEDVLNQVLSGSTDYESMLPDRWKLSHPECIRTYRQQERRDKADQAQLKAAIRRQVQL